jgi:glycosyltransferase involved in cell wall biosynthesis
MNNLKVFLALNSFFPNGCGGTEVYALGLARYLREKNHDVFILIPCKETNCSKYIYDGFTVYQYPVNPLDNILKKKDLNCLAGLDCFKGILSLTKPDVIHFHSYNRAMNSRHIRLAYDMGIKTVFTSHLAGLFCARGDLFYKNTRPCDGKIRLHRCMSCYIHQKHKLFYCSGIVAFGINLFILLFPWIKQYKPSLNFIKRKKEELRNLNKYCDKIISISKWMLNTYALNGTTKAIAICQEVSKNKVKIERHLRRGNKISLIFIGRLYPIKNIELLLNALSSFDKFLFDLTMTVIPNENSMDYYHKIKGKYKLLGYNKWHEKVSQEKVKDLLKSSDLLCLPSISEVAPMVIKEAFDCEIPVIGSDITPISEIVTHGKDGLLFETNNVESLKKQLNQLITDKSLLAKLKNNVRAMTDITDVYRAIEKQYQLLMSTN